MMHKVGHSYYKNHFLDLLLHYLWNNKEILNISETDYNSFLQESFKHTSRPMNPRAKSTAIFLHLCHKLQTNIIILGLKKLSKNHGDIFHSKERKLHNYSKCMVPFYIFHHYLYSLALSKNKQQIVFCYHQQKFYLVTNTDCVTPLLISHPSSPSVQFQNTTVSNIEAWNILNSQPVKQFSFSIILYSSFEYIKYQPKQTKMKSNIVGAYYYNTRENNCHNQLHLLLTPCLKNFQFYLTIITLPLCSNFSINLQNNLTTSHTPEGIKLAPSPCSIAQKEKGLNEEYCICQHPETQLLKKKKFSSPRQYNPLGKKWDFFLLFSYKIQFQIFSAPKKSHKFLLQENLGEKEYFYFNFCFVFCPFASTFPLLVF